MVRILLVLLLCAGVPADSDRRDMRKDLRRKCYSVGTCMPPSQPDGTMREICSVFRQAVRCLQGALEACRLLGFPANSLTSSEQQIKELRHLIALQCSNQSTTAPSRHPPAVPTATTPVGSLSSLSSATSSHSTAANKAAEKHRQTKSGGNSLHTDAFVTTPVFCFVSTVFSALVTTAGACGL